MHSCTDLLTAQGLAQGDNGKKKQNISMFMEEHDEQKRQHGFVSDLNVIEIECDEDDVDITSVY